MTWSAESYIAKARAYVERGLDSGDDSVRAWWFHFAIEPMLRAAVSSIHPALLADPKSVESLLASVGPSSAGGEVLRSRGVNEILEIALRLPAFRQEEKDAAARLLLRRNAECHGPQAIMHGMAEDEWMPDFLRVASACCGAVGVELASLVGQGYADQAAELAQTRRDDVTKRVREMIAAAKTRPAVDVPTPGWTLVERKDGNVLWIAPCPACGGQGQMAGTRVHVGSPRFDGSDLTEPVTIAGRSFHCPRCQLELKSRAELSEAGLPATIRTSDYVDPYEALNLDLAEEAEARGLHVVDPSDFEYRDE